MGEPTPEQIAAYKRGEQKVWRCPDCGDETEVLGAVMVFCAPCRIERKKFVSKVRIDEEASRV